FRRLVVDPALRVMYGVWKLRGLGLGFTEFRYRKAEMDGFLARTNFEVLEVLPDDYRMPWSKGLFVDLCDVGSFFNYEPKPPYEFGPAGRLVTHHTARGVDRLGRGDRRAAPSRRVGHPQQGELVPRRRPARLPAVRAGPPPLPHLSFVAARRRAGHRAAEPDRRPGAELPLGGRQSVQPLRAGVPHHPRGVDGSFRPPGGARAQSDALP